jgi:PGF-CTERM protein
MKSTGKTNNNQYKRVQKNGGLTLFGSSVLCNSSDTWSIGSTRCRHIDGNRQVADNRIHHSGGIIAHIGRLIQPGGIAAWNLGLCKRGFEMKKILVALLIATMMLMALSAAEDVTKSTTTATSTTPGADATKSTTTTTSSAPGPDATKSTTTTTSTTPAAEPTTTTQSTTTTSTPGFEAAFAVAGLLAVAFVALRRRS